MSRRTHKKSRNGCLGCKKRHMRCDGNPPICFNCSSAEIQCSYLDQNLPHTVSALTHSGSNAAASQRDSGALATQAPAPATISLPEPAAGNQEPYSPYTVNMTHLDLFKNLSRGEFLSLEELGTSDTFPATIPLDIYQKHASTIPYLMHQLLAISALHKGIEATTVESRDFYHKFATGLQSRALELFNACHPVLEVNVTNCVQIFLYSSLVGAHLLCDTFHFGRDSLAKFIDHFARSSTVYRGVLAVVENCRQPLHDTELAPYLKSTEFLMHSSQTTRSECDPLRDLVDGTVACPSSRDAYQQSILFLQREFDAHQVTPGSTIPITTVLTWPILISPTYINLLRGQQAQALLILAHYAVLLHRGRDLWLIGDIGRFLIDSICASLGSEWQVGMKFPESVLREV